MKMETRSTLLTLPTASPPNSCVSNCKWNGPFVLITSLRQPPPHPEPPRASRLALPSHGHAKPTGPRSWGHCTTSSLPGREAGRPVPRPAGRAPRQVAGVHSHGWGGVETKVGAFELRVGVGKGTGRGGQWGDLSLSVF